MTFPFSPAPELLPRRLFTDDVEPVHVLTEEELREFLEDISDLKDTINLWNRVSGIPGLLNARLQTEVQQQAYKPVATFFDVEDGVWRYVRSNRRVPQKYVRLGVLRVSKASEQQMRELTTRLVNGEIGRQEWYDAMRTMMKNEYRADFLAAIGGIENYDRSQISRFGWRMRPHYRWLNNFMEEILSGKQALNGRAVIRAGMYGRAGNSIYQNELLEVATRSGMREGIRDLGETENHCNDTINRPGCVELSELGWVPITQLVPLGDASCYSNCLCSYRFRR